MAQTDVRQGDRRGLESAIRSAERKVIEDATAYVAMLEWNPTAADHFMDELRNSVERRKKLIAEL